MSWGSRAACNDCCADFCILAACGAYNGPMPNQQEHPEKPSIGRLIKSTLASFVGVQSDANLDKDDAYIDKVGFRPYIVMGIILTLAFVALVWGVVQLVLRFAAT